MKKLMFTLAICSLAITSAQAQKQLGGEHNVEVNLTPFGNGPIDGTTFKYRNFLDDDKALRVSLTVGSTSDTYAYWQEGEATDLMNDSGSGDPTTEVSPQLNLETATNVIGLSVGYEIHFSGTDNLSPYFGVEAYYLSETRNDKIESWGPNNTANVSLEDVWVVWDVTNKQSKNSMGLNLLFGADYYFSDAIYIGFEAGLGLGVSSYGQHEIGTSDLTAFNMMFGGAVASAGAGVAVSDSYTGYLPFDAASEELGAVQAPGFFGINASGATFEGGVYVDYDEAIEVNNVSNLSIGNVFNGAIRVGFLFD
jgi:hypothetical protein